MKNLHNLCKKIKDGGHLVQNKVFLQGMLKMNLLLYFQANCRPNFPEKKQIHNFLHIFFYYLLTLKKNEKKIIFKKFFWGGLGVGIA